MATLVHTSNSFAYCPRHMNTTCSCIVAADMSLQQKLDDMIIRGIQGEQGAQGPPGPVGLPAPHIMDVVIENKSFVFKMSNRKDFVVPLPDYCVVSDPCSFSCECGKQ